MEVFAGFGEYADTEIGRLISAIDELGQLDNTLVFYIIGDNGASAEGGMNGLFNESTYFNRVTENVADILKHIDELGGPNTYPHYAAGWAVAGDTPFTWTKQIASNYGGTRNGLVVHWPKGIEAKNEVRSQWHHVIDVAPTVLDAAGLARAEERRRHAADPDPGRQHGLFLRRRDGEGPACDAIFRDREEIARSTTMAGSPATIHARPGNIRRARNSPTTSGSSTTRAPTSASRMTSRR